MGECTLSSDLGFQLRRSISTDCRSWVLKLGAVDFVSGKKDDHIEAWIGSHTAWSSLFSNFAHYKEETTHYEIINHF